MLLIDQTDYPRAYGVDGDMHYIVHHAGARPVWVYAEPERSNQLSIFDWSAQFSSEQAVLDNRPSAHWAYERMALPPRMAQKFNDWYQDKNHVSH